jgi:Uma2 family endonuclease
MAATLTGPAEAMTFEDFLLRYDGSSAEWVDGVVHREDLSDVRRSRLRGFLLTLLQVWAEERGLGEVYAAPLTVRLSDRIALEPDLFFVGIANCERVRDSHVEGAPDLVVEIVSRGARADVHGTRLRAYETAGVPELWRVDADHRVAETWRLGGGGRYLPIGMAVRPAMLESEGLGGIRLPAEWLWQEPLPRLTEVQKAWGLI